MTATGTAGSGAAEPTPPGSSPARLRPVVPPPPLSLQPPVVSGVGWDWSAANQDDARTLEAALHAFVDFLNARYAWTPEQAVPPCWDRHGALIEELTTLMWSRWVAFQCPDATPDAAQTWHSYTLPSFLARVNYWLGSAGPECRAGQHQPSPRATLYPSRR